MTKKRIPYTRAAPSLEGEMRFFLDTEFDGYKGDLISMALVPLNNLLPEFYIAIAGMKCTSSFVVDNVVDNIVAEGADPDWINEESLPEWLNRYLSRFDDAMDIHTFIADWPDDIARLCAALMIGPGSMISTKAQVAFHLWRVDAYPTPLEGAIQHNALWDARALRYRYSEG